jgi:hypothetical protein
MPTDGDIDYCQFSRVQLLESLANIDPQQYPQNHQHLLAEIARRDSDFAERQPDKPKRVLQVLKLRGNVTGSVVTKVFYGAAGMFYCLLPVYVIVGVHKPISSSGWAAAATVIVWIIAAFHLFGLCVTYRFENGAIRCLLFNRHILWKDTLDSLEDVQDSWAKGLITTYFVWPDHRRRLWLSVTDLESAA